MSQTGAKTAGRERTFKGAVAGKERRKATVTGYRVSSEPSLEVRLFRDHRDQGEFIDMTLPQARELVRLLTSAIESAANAIPATTGRSIDVTGREPAGLALSHVSGQ